MPNKEASTSARVLRLGRDLFLSGTLAVGTFGAESLPNPPKAEANPEPVVTIHAPLEGQTMLDMGAGVGWEVSKTVTQIHWQLIPFNNDGSGVNKVLGDQRKIHEIRNIGISRPSVRPENANSCLILPDMGYKWRLRASTSPTAIDPNRDDGWGPWAERGFRTPTRTSENLNSVFPEAGGVVDSLTPRLQWSNGDNPDVFYYEIQISKDQNFETDPQKATAAVTWELVNVCAQPAPYLFYRVRSAYSLEPGQTYHWRVRPRIQGDGTPVPFSETWNFKTSPTAVKSLTHEDLVSPAVEQLQQLKSSIEPGSMKARFAKEGVIFEQRRLNRQQRRHQQTP